MDGHFNDTGTTLTGRGGKRKVHGVPDYSTIPQSGPADSGAVCVPHRAIARELADKRTFVDPHTREGFLVFRNALFTLVFLTLIAPNATAQQWARKMFEDHSHDFGTVARGSKQEFLFVMTNMYKEDIHISSVRSSCNCTSVSIADDKRTLKTWEKGAIKAKYNTGSFLGHKSATITVVIDRPYYAEVQMTVKGNVTSSLALTPDSIQFGSVGEGLIGQQKIRISHTGRSNWQVVDVRSASKYIEVELSQTHRSSGRVGYDLIARLKQDAPPGYLNEQLILITNDGYAQKIPVMVEGRVMPALTVSPASLSLGTLEPGKSITKQLVVRGRSPFKITCVDCDQSKSFEFDTSAEAKALHLVPVTFTAGDEPGKVVQTISIKTDLGVGASASCTATATVKSTEPAPDAEPVSGPKPDTSAADKARQVGELPPKSDGV